MDKYTIDLDKLLNDFEYSELTENFNASVSQPVFNYAENRKYETLPETTYPRQKHSINNVFHSLNEYLNSDIKNYDKPELSEINEIEANVPTFVSTPQSSITEIFKNVSSDNSNLTYSNSDITSNIEIPSSSYVLNTNLTYANSDITSNLASNVSENNSFVSTANSLPYNSNLASNVEIPSSTLVLNKNLSLTYANSDITSHVSENSSFISATDSLPYNSNVKDYTLPSYSDNLNNQNLSNDYALPAKLNVEPSSGNSNLSVIPNLSSLSKDFSKEDYSLTYRNTDTLPTTASDKQDIKNPESPKDLQKITFNNEIINNILTDDKSEIIKNSNLNLIENIHPKTVNEEANNSNVDKSILDFEPGSKTISEIDSSVICTNQNQPETVEKLSEDVNKNELLPDETYSDDESESTLKDVIKNDLTKNTNETLNVIKNVKEVPKINFQDLEISDTEMENELAQLEEEYQDKLKLENLEKETELDVGIVQDVRIETEDLVSEVTKVQENEIPTETVMEISPQNSAQAVNNSVDINVNIEDSETVQTSENATSSEKRENFALLRPNSLDLNPETPENSPINLIGNPGSTPYNNVYQSTIPQPSDVTQSLSPTVSEVSTSEASDSPNTSDSCNDTSLDDNLNDSKGDSERKEGDREQDNASGENQENEKEDDRPVSGPWLGKAAPFWTPDSDTLSCLHCNIKFTVIKRRHHCRACGLVLCSKCCNMKFKLEYMDNAEARVCMKCYEILSKDSSQAMSSGSEGSAESQGASPVSSQNKPLNPGNPMEYCSVVPPHQQVGNLPVTPPSVMVPVGVLKRKGSGKSRSSKSVMFCDGIRPGCDLTELDYDFNYKSQTSSSRNATPVLKTNRNTPKMDTKTNSYIPNEENSLPPTVNVVKSEVSYTECANNQSVVEMLRNETLTFAVQRNLHIHVRIINMDCCINKHAWCFTTEGMIAVGQDEIVILLEFVDNEKTVPKDLFLHLNNIYNEAVKGKGTSITEMGLSIHNSSNFLESKNHAGFLYVKPSFQCVQNVILPKEPYLIGILIHRWETPWAKIFPLRLLLRLGAEYRYYPSPIISTRHRESVYVEIGHTIINLLADFRNFSYTLPNVRGLTIHMKEKNTTVSIPINRYDQVMKALNNSSDHILAFAANFSPKADSHLVCIQDTHGNNENAYTTHAINIHNKPRKEIHSMADVEENNFDLTGASFIVLNGALKSSSGLTAKSSIVEDGLMIQILPEQMVKLRSSLRNMKDFKINCGCVNAQSDEFVNIVWTENDINFNVGVVSPIDNMALSGVPSIRVHNGRDYICNSGNKMIRWTEVFIIQSGDENIRTQEPVDISKLSESISKATCQALVKYLDLLATNSFMKLGIRTTLHVENVSYLAGSNGVKLPPIYMKSLDNELIPILHKITSNNLGENAIVIELIFHILNM